MKIFGKIITLVLALLFSTVSISGMEFRGMKKPVDAETGKNQSVVFALEAEESDMEEDADFPPADAALPTVNTDVYSSEAGSLPEDEDFPPADADFPPADAEIEYSPVQEEAVETVYETVPAAVEENGSYSLKAPVLIGAKKVDDGVEVSWDKVQGAEMYRVFRRSAGEEWENFGDTEETVFVDVMADPGMEYYYTVCCVTADSENYTSSSDSEGIVILVE